jgi:hypothetical protein
MQPPAAIPRAALASEDHIPLDGYAPTPFKPPLYYILHPSWFASDLLLDAPYLWLHASILPSLPYLARLMCVNLISQDGRGVLYIKWLQIAHIDDII